jgi:hypothetical protein
MRVAKIPILFQALRKRSQKRLKRKIAVMKGNIKMFNRSSLCGHLSVKYSLLHYAEKRNVIPAPSIRIGKRFFYTDAEVQKITEWTKRLKRTLYGWFQPDVNDLTAETAIGVYAAPMTQDQKDEIKLRSKEGESGVEIASRMGLPVRKIYSRKYHLRSQRQMELPQSQPKEKFELANKMWLDGKTMKQIAEVYGYTLKRLEGVIVWYRKRFGWFPKRYT